MSKSRYVFRDAATGEFVTEEYALENPRTTIRHKVVVRDEKYDLSDDSEE